MSYVHFFAYLSVCSHSNINVYSSTEPPQSLRGYSSSLAASIMLVREQCTTKVLTQRKCISTVDPRDPRSELARQSSQLKCKA